MNKVYDKVRPMGAIAGVMSGGGDGLATGTFGLTQGTAQMCSVRSTQWNTRIELYAPTSTGACSDAKLLHNELRDKCLFFDGYVANGSELRAGLKAKGHQFKTRSDAETVLHLYEDLGANFVEPLDGDFALAVADKDSIILARDRFGTKTLYYAYLEDKNLFLFASQIKSLLQFVELTPEIDEARMVDLMVFPHPLGGRSFIKGVRSVRPGSTLRVRHQGGRLQLEERVYFRPQFEPSAPVTFERAKTSVAELLIKAVGSRLPSDERVALTLSGGIDSTTIALIAHEHYSKRLTTFTLGSSPTDQDAQLARATAAMLKSEHHELLFSFDDYLRTMPRYVSLMERPLLSVETPFLFLCQAVAREAQMCLVGEGADHVFSGGLDYFIDKRMRRRLEAGTDRAQRLGLQASDEVSAFVSDLCEAKDHEQYMKNLNRRCLTDIFPVGGQFYYSCAREVGLEVRDPYLHGELVAFLGSAPMSLKVNRAQLIDKYLLRYTSLRLFGSKVLEAVLCRKRGLDGPFREYEKRFEQLCQTRLSDRYVARHPFGAYFPEKHHLILFDLFKLIFIDHRGRCPADLDMLAFIDERADGTAPPLRGRRLNREHEPAG